MTTATQTHAYIDLLAAATKACPECNGEGLTDRGLSGSMLLMSCEGCHGTGTVPRFPGARRKCRHANWHSEYPGEARCPDCNGTGEVPDYDALESAVMAGLTIEQGLQVASIMYELLEELPLSFGDPMPSQPEIRKDWLKSVCEVKLLEEEA